MSVGAIIGIVYIMQTIGGCMPVGVFICIVDIMPKIWGIYVCQLVYVGGCLWALRAKGWGICVGVFSMVLYLPCQQFRG